MKLCKKNARVHALVHLGIVSVFVLPVLAGCDRWVKTATDGLGGLSEDIWALNAKHPQPTRDVHYIDNDSFDHQLSASLRADYYQEVSVNFDEQKFSIKNTPGRIDKWLLEVDQSDGDSYRCTTDPNESSGLALAIGRWLWDVAYNTWIDWETFRPARTRNVELWINGADQETVEFIRFKRREGYSKPTQCEPNANS
jgi:hypothetical protein